MKDVSKMFVKKCCARVLLYISYRSASASD